MLILQAFPGCTPLHWAALRGNAEACTLLVHAGTKEELTVKDNAGLTPAELASDKGHRQIALILVGNSFYRNYLLSIITVLEQFESFPTWKFKLVACIQMRFGMRLFKTYSAILIPNPYSAIKKKKKNFMKIPVI